MAITYESSQTASNANNTITITKPSGTAVGDMLVAVISCQNTIAGGGIPTGWTQLTSDINTDGVTTYFYYVVATSTQVAASNFTWDGTSGFAISLSGGIARFSGEFHSTPFGVFAADDDVATTTPTFTNTVTPNTPSSILLFASGAGSIASGGVTVSSQAITTSNPTWAEAFDVNYSVGGGSPANTQAALAYAVRPEITATGNSSYTLSASRPSVSIMVVFRTKVITTTTETESVIDTPNKGITKYFLETETTTDTLTTLKQKDWNNTTKNSSSWVNQDKH